MKRKPLFPCLTSGYRLLVPVILIGFATGIMGDAAEFHPSLGGLWRRKASSEVAPEEKSEKSKRGVTSTKKPAETKSSGKFVDRILPSRMRSKTASESTSKSSDQESRKDTVTAQSERRERLRTYIDQEDSKKASPSKKPAVASESESDEIHQVSKSQKGSSSDRFSGSNSLSRSSKSDPFLDEEDPVAAASELRRKELSFPNGRRARDVKVTESVDELNKLDAEMADLGVEKKDPAELEDARNLDALLESEEQPVETKKSEKKLAARSSSEEEVNPFEELEEETPVSSSEKKKALQDLIEEDFVPTGEVPHLSEEPVVAQEKAPAEDLKPSEEEFTEVVSNVKPVGHENTVVETTTSPDQGSTGSAREEADDLVLQALSCMKKNRFDEAYSLAESAVEIETTHQLEYTSGEESPSRLLKQLSQLKSLMEEDSAPVVTPKAIQPTIKPDPASLPSLSPDVQPIDDSSAGISSGTTTQRVSYTEKNEDSVSSGVALATKPEPLSEKQEGVTQAGSTPIPAGESGPNPFEGLESDKSTGENGPQFVAQKEAASEAVSHPDETVTTFAPAISESAKKTPPSSKRQANSLGMLLIGISLVSLGCAGVFFWKMTQPRQGLVSTGGPPQTTKNTDGAQKGA